MVTATPTDLTVADPPLDAVAIHGNGRHIERLFDAYTMQWLLRLIGLAPRLEPLGLDDGSPDRFGSLVRWLVGLPPAEARVLFREPVFAAWIVRLWKSVEAGDQTSLRREIDEIPFILLRNLEAPALGEALLDDLELPTRIAPVGSGWRITGRGVRDERVSLRRTSRGVDVVGSRSRLCHIPLAELAPRSDGASIRVFDHDALVVERRNFVLGDRVEVLPDAACPELSEHRAPAELPSALGAAAIERELRRAHDLLERVWPESLYDVERLFGATLPIEMAAGSWNSASTGELPFVLQLTFREDSWPFLLADSILHETAHVKLDMAMLLTPLLENDDRKIYRHPWRPDLRPMVGVLLGAHAFLSVMKLYERGLRIWPRDASVREQYEQRRAEVGIALGTLAESAEFTPAGAVVYRAMVEAFEESPPT